MRLSIVTHFLLVPEFVKSGNYNNCQRRTCSPVNPPVWSGSMDTFFEDYRTFEDIQYFIDQLVDAYPTTVTAKIIGNTSEGRLLKVLEISNKSGVTPPSERPVMYFQAGIHSREWISVSTALFITTKLLTEAPQEALQKYVFVCMPLLNPDGYVYSWKWDRMWRKNRNNLFLCTSQSNYPGGTDLNRNWGYMWNNATTSAYLKRLMDPCSNLYAGAHPFSEPESYAVSRYLAEVQRKSMLKSKIVNGSLNFGSGYVASFIDYHNYGQVFLPPWAYTETLPLNYKYQKSLNEVQVEAIKNYSNKIFRYGPNEFPSDPGTAPDWSYGVLGIKASMTVELDPSSWSAGDRDAGRNGFCIGKESIKLIGLEQWEAYKALINFCNAFGCEPSSTVGAFANTTTCGNLKMLFKSNNCCGKPSKVVGPMSCGDIKNHYKAMNCCREPKKTVLAMLQA